MKLFEITNGYIGEGPVRCLVIAASAEAAIEMARERFRLSANGRYKPSYWTELLAECPCEDTGQLWTGEVTD